MMPSDDADLDAALMCAGLHPYLELDDSLKVRVARRDRAMAEAPEHLEEAVGAREGRGASGPQAEVEAIGPFGPPAHVAASFKAEGVTAFDRAAVLRSRGWDVRGAG